MSTIQLRHIVMISDPGNLVEELCECAYIMNYCTAYKFTGLYREFFSTTIFVWSTTALMNDLRHFSTTFDFFLFLLQT